MSLISVTGSGEVICAIGSGNSDLCDRLWWCANMLKTSRLAKVAHFTNSLEVGRNLNLSTASPGAFG